jgi:hypothetical protein
MLYVLTVCRELDIMFLAQEGDTVEDCWPRRTAKEITNRFYTFNY